MMTLDEGHVTTIAVDPRRHRSKIGTRLLLVLAREAIARGATALTLEVRMSNTAAQDLYRRFGFGPVGVRKNYYQEVNEDALVMWAHEVDQPAYAELLDVDRAHASRARRSSRRRGAGDAHPRHRDVVRRDRGRGRRGRPHRALVGGVEPGRPARALRRRGARGREPRPRRADHAGDRGGARRGGRRAHRPRRGGRVPRSGPRRRAARRGERGEGASRSRPTCRTWA